jgi:plastocyanin
LTIRTPTIAFWRAQSLNALMAAALVAAPAAFAQSADSSKGHEYKVVMSNMDYGATPSKLKVGDTITWVNNDTVMHSVTAKDHSFDLRLNPGQSAQLTLAKAGRIPFYCLFHPNMSGTLNVSAQ